MVLRDGGSGAAAPGELSILDRTSGTPWDQVIYREKRPGVASSSTCYRQGKVWLVSNSGEYGWLPTTCKTWRCKGCRDRMTSLFKARVEIGCSILQRCAFITGTYKLESPRLEDAGCVKRDWKALWRSLPQYRESLKWLRVMEVTKKMTPHWHMVAGTITDDIRCWTGKLRIGQYNKRWESCECLAHNFARAWYAVTGDSYIVHTTPVLGARGAGAYMAKYLSKTFGTEGRHKALGMSRRWSSSRGWPGSGRQRLAPSEGEGWKQRIFEYGHLTADLVDSGTFTRVGNEATLAYFARKKEDRGPNAIRRLLDA